jgi:acetyltransferase-like isoleucine patch superfamily enzyme
MLRDGRLEVGRDVVFEPLVWLTGGEQGRIRLGDGVLLNVGVMIASLELVEIGEHTMIANGSVVADSNHRFDDPTRPITHQGFTSKGPTRIGPNCWLGANVTVTSGVTIGERCVVGAGSVVVRDVPAFSVVAGAPAKVIGRVPGG